VVLARARVASAAAARSMELSFGIEGIIEGRHKGVLLRCGPGPRRAGALQLATRMPIMTPRRGIDSDVFQAFTVNRSHKCALRLGICLFFDQPGRDLVEACHP